METLRLNFETILGNEKRTLVVEIPYQEGMVATSEFCPNEFMSGPIKLMAAVRGESLDDFIIDCRRQLSVMSKIDGTDSDLDLHIGGLMAVVMDHLSREETISFGDLLRYTDCFSLLLKGAGFPQDEIHAIYRQVVDTLIDLYPANILRYSAGVNRNL